MIDYVCYVQITARKHKADLVSTSKLIIAPVNGHPFMLKRLSKDRLYLNRSGAFTFAIFGIL